MNNMKLLKEMTIECNNIEKVLKKKFKARETKFKNALDSYEKMINKDIICYRTKSSYDAVCVELCDELKEDAKLENKLSECIEFAKSLNNGAFNSFINKWRNSLSFERAANFIYPHEKKVGDNE